MSGTTPSLNNMYRVGDYVYFEVHAGYPYQIRRIEELNRANNGSQVLVKVQCYYRRRDIPNALIHLADPSFNDKHPNKRVLDNLGAEQKHSLFHRELFLSRQVETVPAQYIRGKCTVNLISEVESVHTYLQKDDAFFYSLVYDPVQKTILKDQGEMRVGFRYQAETPVFVERPLKGYREETLDTPMWDPNAPVDDEKWTKFMMIARAIGTFSRALTHANLVRETSLVNSAAAASRDVALAYAHDLLNDSKYNIGDACMKLVPETGPLLIQDQSEEWSASEAVVFEEALEKCGKDFGEIRKQFLPWKPVSAIIEYYYMWKTTDRYMRQKRIKATEAESKLKQVYIPSNGTYNNPNKIPVPAGSSQYINSFQCEGCQSKESTAWFLWGPNNICKLCEQCWVYWKKFGGLKKPTAYEKSANDAAVREFKYECKQCKKQFLRQERLVNHMAMHSEFKCLVEGCDKEFKVKNQLHRHLTSVHNLCVTSKSSYAEVLKTREPFLMMPSNVTKQLQKKQRSFFKSLARRPGVDLEEDKLKEIRELPEDPKNLKPPIQNGSDAKTSTMNGKKKVSLDAIVQKISDLYKETQTSRKRILIDKNYNPSGAPFKRLHSELSPHSIKPISWLEVCDNYLFVANKNTQNVRDPKKTKYKRACRNPRILMKDSIKSPVPTVVATE